MSPTPVSSAFPRPPAPDIVPSEPADGGHETGLPPAPSVHDAAGAWTGAAYTVLLAFLGWLPLTFALGYWVSSWFGVDPGSGESIVSTGAVGWLTDVLFGLLVGLPAWAGAAFAGRARHLGAGNAAAVALALNLVIGLGLLALCVAVPL